MKNVNSVCFKGDGDDTSDFGVGGAARSYKGDGCTQSGCSGTGGCADCTVSR